MPPEFRPWEWLIPTDDSDDDADDILAPPGLALRRLWYARRLK